MKDLTAKVFDRFKSPVVWAGVISIVGLIFTTAGYTLADVTSWEALSGVISAILGNPAKLALIVVALYAFLNNPSDKVGF